MTQNTTISISQKMIHLSAAENSRLWFLVRWAARFNALNQAVKCISLTDFAEVQREWFNFGKNTLKINVPLANAKYRSCTCASLPGLTELVILRALFRNQELVTKHTMRAIRICALLSCIFWHFVRRFEMQLRMNFSGSFIREAVWFITSNIWTLRSISKRTARYLGDGNKRVS